ncbi:transmembrane sensor [Sphingomonas sp. SORGH_AS802]|uniref:FecR family protein n=1 Tax=unclassified Sphingomonas TaxID=196159 RepID=UPI002863672B|nr:MULTISPECIES: FecR domain-containing protein [unclassified Sphingomonas]MDR6126449.1 transmembrane sensor [Sphingomonas sp. SORGH_AS_0438]MDR6136279.1 transmembrane sensor [Sphingomonas sp. SORGH_AS_0802]
MSGTASARMAEALDWARRVHEPDFDDWDGHLDWLEADPANAALFDEVSLHLEAATAGLAAEPVAAAIPDAANDNPPVNTSRRWWLGSAMAAALVGVIGIASWPSGPDMPATPLTIATALGQTRSVRLADGTRVAMNGGTTLKVDRATRSLSFGEGEAYFDVVHDPARPFRLQIGAASVEDIGTAFNVRRHDNVIEVAVREGVVSFDPDGGTEPDDDAVILKAGQAIRIVDDRGAVRRVDRTTVGGWRTGQLSYGDVALAEVAGDLSRAIGQPVRLAPDDGMRRFSGTFKVDADAATSVQRFAAISGMRATRDAGGWRLSPDG